MLPRNGEWGYARDFICASPVLDDERREAFLQALDTLREEQAAAERREEEERLRREEAIRRDVEEARRLRAENEARERRRLEEERVRREAEEKERRERAKGGKATEGDFGVESTPASAPATRNGGSGRAKTSGASTSGGAMARPRGALPGRGAGGGASSAVAAPTLMSRASRVLENLRVLVDEIAGAFQTNPYVLLRMLAFVIGLLLLLSRRRIRERIARVIGVSWAKVKATAGMGTKVSYI